MSSQNYEYFRAIAETGSLTRAAQMLYMTQPALSKYLSRIEKALGAPLFDRTRSPMTLTDAGKVFWRYTEQQHEAETRMRKEIDEIINDERGEITLGITTWRSTILLPRLLPAFSRLHPKIRVRVMEGKSYDFEKAMLRNQVDVSLMTLPSNFSHATTYESLGKEKIFLAGNASHPLVQEAMAGAKPGVRPYFDLKKLDGEKFINLKPGQGLARLNLDALHRAGVELRDIWNTESPITALNMVNNTDYFTTVPALCLLMDYLPRNVCLFETGDPPLDWEVAFIYPKDAHISRIQRIFMDALKELWESIGG